MKRRDCLGFLGASLVLPQLARATLAPQAVIAQSRASVFPVGTYAETDSPRFMFRGTGFLVGDGQHMLTNAHVLPEAPAPDAQLDSSERVLCVQLHGTGEMRRILRATVVALDRAHDMALLKLESRAGMPLKLADEGTEGDSVLIMGYPLAGALGYSLVTHRGMISARTDIALPPPSASGLSDQAVHQLREGSFQILQLDATAYPGNSGGPVVSLETGAVIGILNMVFVKGRRESALSTPSGISYAIPIVHGIRLLKLNGLTQ